MSLELRKRGTGPARRTPVLHRRAAEVAFLCVGVAAGALFSGSAGTASGHSPTQNTSQNPAPQTFNVSGTISPAGGANGASVALSGATAMSTTVGGSGQYAFAGLADGTYTVTPSRTGYTFNPTTQVATVSGKD